MKDSKTLPPEKDKSKDIQEIKLTELSVTDWTMERGVLTEKQKLPKFWLK